MCLRNLPNTIGIDSDFMAILMMQPSGNYLICDLVSKCCGIICNVLLFLNKNVFILCNIYISLLMDCKVSRWKHFLLCFLFYNFCLLIILCFRMNSLINNLLKHMLHMNLFFTICVKKTHHLLLDDPFDLYTQLIFVVQPNFEIIL